MSDMGSGQIENQDLRIATIRSAQPERRFLAHGQAIAFLERESIDIDCAGGTLHPCVTPWPYRVVDRIIRAEHRGVHSRILIDERGRWIGPLVWTGNETQHTTLF